MSGKLLELRNIKKRFPGVVALDGVQFDLKPGEIHGLLGENGAGKSTLLKIITGVHQPDEGEIVLDGQRVTFSNPLDAKHAGIAAIYQEPTCFPELSISENVFMGHPIVSGKLNRMDWKAMHKRTEQLLKELNIHLDPRTTMGLLNVAERQLVEIAKALSLDSKILLMDEPTSALTIQEAERLFKVINRLREDGVAIIFISHRLEEVFELTDRVTVLRDGKYIGTKATGELTTQEVIRMMVGRSVDELYPKKEVKIGKPLLEVKNISRHGEFSDISFTVREGEILGIAGLVGAGRTEMARAVFGITSLDRGEILLDNQRLNIKSARDALKYGIAYLPEDRQDHGLVLAMDLAQNTTISILDRFKYSLLNKEKEREITEKYIELLNIRTSGCTQLARNLSGGNQQKVVLAKWMATEPRILILDEPTRGIDVQAKAAVHTLIGELAEQGLGIIIISSELPEVLGISDRILVMHEGKIAAEFKRGEATQELILHAAIGRSSVDADAV
ncbi:MAG: sugar ABC transporter ATP-binding protein [Bacillota bacterium]|jgi:rhamnose transport system ATP-binding protein|nr:sugar ABC transporter ATP-binding protein [Bacillota bacterium]NLJ02416.1 sugar ABC transporter ATP-binding protein [Bacillota bacterium]